MDALVANVLIHVLGVESLERLRDEHWEDAPQRPGLASRLRATTGVGPVTLARIEALWREAHGS